MCELGIWLQRGRRYGVSRRPTILLAVALAGPLIGCAGLSRRGPVSEDVIVARQLSQQGLDAMHRGRLTEAESKFDRAIEHCPTNTTARYQLANCLWKRGANQEAIDQLEQAVELAGSEDVAMLVELGYMQANVGRMDLALQRAEEAIRLAPEFPLAWQLHGDVQREVGQWQTALESYQRSLALDPANLEVQLASAEVYHRLGRPNRVLATLNHLEGQIPHAHRPEQMFVLKSIALEQLERVDEAVEVLMAAARERQLSNVGLVQLAAAQVAAGRDRDAQYTIRVAMRSADAQEQASLRRLMERLASRSAAPEADRFR